MGVSKTPMWEGELSFCPLCGKYRVSQKASNNNKLFTFISKKKYEEILIEGSENR